MLDRTLTTPNKTRKLWFIKRTGLLVTRIKNS